MNARLRVAVFAMLAAPSAWPADTTSEVVERQRIAVERGEADTEFERRNQACQLRFAVTSCSDTARKDYRDTMERLRLQQAMLDESRRRQQAASRIDGIRAKVSAEEAIRRDGVAQERRTLAPRPAPASAAVAAAASAASSASSANAGAAPARAAALSSKTRTARPPVPDRSSTEAKRLAEHEDRQAAAQAHRDAVVRRNAERASSGKKPAASLPVPGAASAP